MKLQICIADYWYDEIMNVLAERRENWDGYPINIAFVRKDSDDPKNNLVWVEVDINDGVDAQYFFLAAIRVGWNLGRDKTSAFPSLDKSSLN